MGFFKKKEEKKKFDYSEETKELFAERDAFYAEQRKQMGGESANPELANQEKPEKSMSREDDLENLLGGGGDFNPYVNADESPSTGAESVAPPTPSKSPSSSSSAFVCTSCGKDFQEKWGKCPSCGGEMKKAETSPSQVEQSPPSSTSEQVKNNNSGDPLDDLLGDFSSTDSKPSLNDGASESDSGVKMVDADNLVSDFGESRSNHSNRKRVKKVKRVKRARKSP